MIQLSKGVSKKQERPVKVVQFGEGNFLRGFVDYMIDVANETVGFDGDVVIVKPIEFGNLERFQRQECQYTVSLRGITDGIASVKNRLVTSVTDAVGAYEEYEKYSNLAKLDTLRFVVSNTTEAGIVYLGTEKLDDAPPKSFPAKLTALLYERFKAGLPGFIILSCELIDKNGDVLKECVLKFVNQGEFAHEVKFVDKFQNAFFYTLYIFCQIFF